MGRYIGIAVGIIVVVVILAWIFGGFEGEGDLEAGGADVEVEETVEEEGEVEVEGTATE